MMPEPVHIPRSEWQSHLNFPQQVLLLGSHESFRQVSLELVKRTTSVDSLRASELLYLRWISAMRSHESYEEGKLYPFLEMRWGVSMNPAADGHEELHRADERVRDALAVGDVDAVVAALEAHDRVLNVHLNLEEELVIPLLLELTPAEFREYYTLSIHALRRRLQERR